VSNGNGCPYCSNKKVNDENSLGTLNPKLSRQWHPTKNGYLQPNDVTEKSGKRVWWKCNRGHEWKSTIAHRSNGRCCPKCSKIVLKDGTVCDSKVEAYYYLSLINQGLVKGVDFKHNGYYCQEQDHFNEFGKIRYDFYLIKQNKYIEITSFTKEFNKWVEYFCNVLYKYQFVNIVLGDHFEFIQKTLTSEENNIVTKNME
jgi:hypothetical protein